MLEIGIRIRQLREAHGVKRRDLARYLGIPEWEVERLESGERLPTTKMLSLMATALDVKFTEFFEDPWQNSGHGN